MLDLVWSDHVTRYITVQLFSLHFYNNNKNVKKNLEFGFFFFSSLKILRNWRRKQKRSYTLMRDGARLSLLVYDEKTLRHFPLKRRKMFQTTGVEAEERKKKCVIQTLYAEHNQWVWSVEKRGRWDVMCKQRPEAKKARRAGYAPPPIHSSRLLHSYWITCISVDMPHCILTSVHWRQIVKTKKKKTKTHLAGSDRYGTVQEELWWTLPGAGQRSRVKSIAKTARKTHSENAARPQNEATVLETSPLETERCDA